MSKFSNTVEYSLRTKLDSSGLNELQGQIASISASIDTMNKKGLLSKSTMHEAQSNLQTLQQALGKSFNSSTGLINVKQLQSELNGLTLGQLEKSFSAAGNTGRQVFGNFLSQIGQIDTSFKSVSSTVDKIANTFGNTVRWGVTASIFQTMQNSIYRAVEYVKELDTSLNNIRIVSGQSAEQMRDFSLYANEAAKNLGQTTTAFTDASLIFLQQGLDQNTSNQLADLTLRMANVTQQDTATASEQITSIMNGYNMTIQETTDAIDVLANVAAQGASDMEELATAESRVAATASTLGVSQEQLAAQISTIISVTRQAPETVGNSLRTLYSRFADLKMGETLEDGVDLGTFSSEIAEVGVQVLDETGNLRNMGDIIEDLMVKWQDLSSAQQISLGTTLAGRYQLNPFLTLMNNMEMYNEQLAIANDSAGTLDEQQAIYMDSLAAKTNQLVAAQEGLVSTLFNPDDYKPAIETLTALINLITDLVNAIGGAGPVFLGLGSILTKVFSKSIGTGINNVITNFERNRQRGANVQAVNELIAQSQQGGEVGQQAQNKINEQMYSTLRTNNAQGMKNAESSHQASLELMRDVFPQAQRMSTEQQEQYNNALKETVTLENRVLQTKNNQVKATKNLENALQESGLKDFYTGKDIDIDELDKQFTDAEYIVKSLASTGESGVYSGLFDADDGETVISSLDTYLSGIRTRNEDVQERMLDATNIGDKLYEQIRGMTSSDDIFSAVADSGLQAAFDAQIADAREFLAKYQSIVEQKEEYDRAMGNATNAQAALDSQRGANRGMGQNISRQIKIQDMVNLAGSVSELAFAWSSFQELGSLVTDDDISAVDKFGSVLGNLLFTIPSIATAIGPLKTGLSGLGVALSAPQILAVVAAFSALMAVIGGVQQAFENEKQAQMDAMNEAKQTLDTVNSQVSSFDTLYEEYRRTGEVSDALKQSAQELSDTLGVQGGNALIASENFDALASSIYNAQEAAAQNSLDTAIQAQQGTLSKSIDGGWFQNGVMYDGSLESDFFAAMGTNPRESNGTDDISGWSSYFGDEYTELLNNPEEPIEYIRSANDAVEYLSEGISEIERQINEASISGESTEQLESRLKTYQDRLAAIQGFLNDETVTSYQASLEQGAAAEIQLHQDEFSNLSGQELIDAYMGLDTAQFATYAQQFSDYSDALQFLINNTSDSAQRISLEAEQAKLGFAQEAKVATDSDQLADDIYKQLDESNLSSEEIVTLRAELDYNTLVENINEIIERVNNGEDIEDIIADIKPQPISEMPTTNVRTDEDITALQEELDMTADEYNDYVDAMRAGDGELGPQGEGIQQINAALEENAALLKDAEKAQRDAQDEYGEASEEYEEATKTVEEYSEAIDNNEQLLEDIESRAVESAKGVEELSEVFEDSAKSIRTASKDSLEYTDAVNSLVPGLEHLLNIDMSGWDQALTNEFVSQNLNDIEAAINGDIYALQRLRSAAAMEIMVQAGLDPNTSPELYQQMLNIIDWANLNLPDLQAGASIDNTVFMAQLDNMVKNAYAAGYSIDEILAALNGMGLDAEISYEAQPITWTVDVPKVYSQAAEAAGKAAPHAHGRQGEAQEHRRGAVGTARGADAGA